MPRKTVKLPTAPAEHKGGRISDYSDELAEQLCEVIALHGRISDAFALAPRSTLYRWIGEHPDLRDKITRAQEIGYENAKRKGYDALNRMAPKSYKAASALVQCVQRDESLLIDRRKADKPGVVVNNNVSVVNVEQAKGLFARLEAARKAGV